MKKLTVWLMVLSLGLFTIGCGETTDDAGTTPATPDAPATPPAGEPADDAAGDPATDGAAADADAAADGEEAPAE